MNDSWCVLGVPSSAGAHHAGTEAAPTALREQGLIESLQRRGLDVTDLGDLESRTFHPDLTHPNARSRSDVKAVAQQVSRACRAALSRGHRMLLLGGDCTISIGLVHAMLVHGNGDLGLLYVDGNADLKTPSTTTSGILDAMVVANLLGEAKPSILNDLRPATPLLRDDQLALLGFDEADTDSFDGVTMARRPGVFRAPDKLVAADPVRAARQALQHVRRPGRPLMIHFDVDVIDSCELSLGDFPHYGSGITMHQAGQLLSELCGEGEVRVVVVTEVNPSHDPSNVALRRLISSLSSSLGASSTLR